MRIPPEHSFVVDSVGPISEPALTHDGNWKGSLSHDGPAHGAQHQSDKPAMNPRTDHEKARPL
jgi:hypothetical protein